MSDSVHRSVTGMSISIVVFAALAGPANASARGFDPRLRYRRQADDGHPWPERGRDDHGASSARGRMPRGGLPSMTMDDCGRRLHVSTIRNSTSRSSGTRPMARSIPPSTATNGLRRVWRGPHVQGRRPDGDCNIPRQRNGLGGHPGTGFGLGRVGAPM
jgi:hypothetical protein